MEYNVFYLEAICTAVFIPPSYPFCCWPIKPDLQNFRIFLYNILVVKFRGNFISEFITNGCVFNNVYCKKQCKIVYNIIHVPTVIILKISFNNNKVIKGIFSVCYQQHWNHVDIIIKSCICVSLEFHYNIQQGKGGGGLV